MVDKGEVRVVPAVHGARKVELDAAFELGFTEFLSENIGAESIFTREVPPFPNIKRMPSPPGKPPGEKKNRKNTGVGKVVNLA